MTPPSSSDDRSTEIGVIISKPIKMALLDGSRYVGLSLAIIMTGRRGHDPALQKRP